MRHLAVIAVAGGLLSAPAFAFNDLVSMQLATELGGLIASEDICDLTLDQAAIESWIEAKIPADDMSFMGSLDMMIEGTKYNLRDMGASQKAAHCMQARRSAKAAGFID
ncbi:hypothetical protein [Polycladidibacter hongkongensis]|uniref:hypothetical protein n=1 Tax=Polycladidibacter hongkongensis TaxID=1647556 RepID=UPI000833EA3D|nr:hypothetical protein [Pseudovibrio hongkongensis]